MSSHSLWPKLAMHRAHVAGKTVELEHCECVTESARSMAFKFWCFFTMQIDFIHYDHVNVLLFLPSFLSFFPSFSLPSFLPSFLPLFLPSFLPPSLPSFLLLSYYFIYSYSFLIREFFLDPEKCFWIRKNFFLTHIPGNHMLLQSQ